MKIIASSCFSLLLVLTGANAVVCQNPIKARTETGKEVILLPDGTWKYVPEAAPGPSSVGNKPAGATTLYKARGGGFGIWYDSAKWVMEAPAQDQTTVQFKLKQGDAYAIVLIEEVNIPVATLKEAALANAKKAGPDAQVIFEETRIVNKKEVLCIKLDATIKGISFRYYGYYYGGKNGSIQFLTFSGRDFFTKYEQDFTDFLNGLEIY